MTDGTNSPELTFETNSYRTSDFSLAAYLYCKGFQVTDLENSPKSLQKKVFVFDRTSNKTSDSVEQVVKNYFAKVADVAALDYKGATYQLKSMLSNASSN